VKYLLVTSIPFAQDSDNAVLIDRLWLEDLRGSVAAIGPIAVAAPQVKPEQLRAWGPGLERVDDTSGISFIRLPSRSGRADLLYRFRLRRVLRRAVINADVVHTSNLFEPGTELYYGHDFAVRRGIKTIFVVAEDFYDMLGWEWVRTAVNPLQHWRRRRSLQRLDAHVRRRVRNASLTFLHTPAAVSRYRLDAGNPIAIRQPAHEREDVINEQQLADRLARCEESSVLKIVTASRLRPLKGLDLLIRAVALLKQRGVGVCLTIYGDGPQRSYLESLAVRLAIADSVRFGGAISVPSVLRETLAAADLFAMPHLTNDFGRAFFDAMCAGCPVVAFRSIASEDTVRDGVDGLIVPNADPEALATAIARFRSEIHLLVRGSYAARTRALQNTRTGWHEMRAGWVRELFEN
jgi:glycosyltransferase involved in cell wall biosynthesis